MYTNDKIELLIRATRLYCYNMYKDYDPKFYPTIKNVVLGFTNKIFGTKSKADRVNINIISTFESKTRMRAWLASIFRHTYPYKNSRYFGPRI